MFVSLLHLMGFPASKPLHSRAKEKTAVRASEPEASALQEQTVRRSIVKTSVSKSKKVPAKPAQAGKTGPLAKATKAVKPAKAVKPVTPVKLAKPVKVAKPVAPSRSAKTVAKPTAKATTKPAAKPTTRKETIKASAKTIAPTPKVVPVVKPSPAKARPVAAVAPPSPTISKKKTEPVTRVVETKAPISKTTKKIKVAAVQTPAKAAVSAATLTSLGVPVRSGRPSSRLAQLTVPSMAQSVASNAAKASFTQMPDSQPIVSPITSTVNKDPKLANNWKKKSVNELTNEEIIAMSDKEYMNDTQMAYFRWKLLTLKNDILSNAGETTEHLREDTVVVPDPADRATIEEEHALELRTRDRERKLLKKIDQSINRIDAGDYGYCDETGEPIGVARLLARPTATLSLEAQQRRELKQKMFGD